MFRNKSHLVIFGGYFSLVVSMENDNFEYIDFFKLKKTYYQL